MYDALADFVVVMHFLFIVFATLGALLALHWRWVIWAHLPAMAWAAATEFFGIICPLTYLENYLRSLGASGAYSMSFIERYLVPIVYPAELTRELQWFLGGGLIVINAVIYAIVWRRSVAKRTVGSGAASESVQ
jgi:hypothetical protein